MKINELQRLRVSFGSFEPSAKATPYAAQEAKAVTLTLAYIQRGDKAPTWELLQTGRAGPGLYRPAVTTASSPKP